jgi:hypothetical protein
MERASIEEAGRAIASSSSNRPAGTYSPFQCQFQKSKTYMLLVLTRSRNSNTERMNPLFVTYSSPNVCIPPMVTSRQYAIHVRSPR